MKYQNPVIKGFHPDPSVCFDGRDFYLVTSTFEFFPGVPVFRSRNLVNWELVGHCLTDGEQLPLGECRPSGGIYAPTIRYHEGRYYMVTTNVSYGGHLIVHTGDPAGKWSAPVYVDQDGIDPSLLFDGDKVYFVSTLFQDGRQAIAMCEIDPLTGEKRTPTTVISHGCGGKFPEAPHQYRIGDYYYLMLAEGGTEYGHMVTISRSKSPYGPYEPCPHNPILTHRNEQVNPIQCTGHADLVEDANGNWWMVCLAVRPVGALLHNLGRETCLAPVKWENGWPVVGNGGRIAAEMDAPLPEEPFAPCFDFADALDGTALRPEWTFVRNPHPERYEPSAQGLRMTGNGTPLSDPRPVFAGIRQTEFVTRTQVELKLSAPDTDAGLAAYYNTDYYYALHVLERSGKRYARLEKKVHGEEMQACEVALEGADVLTLHLDTDRDRYSFWIEEDGRQIPVGSGSVAGLCTEGTMTMTFTGVFLGLFAQEGQAAFRNFSYREIGE